MPSFKRRRAINIDGSCIELLKIAASERGKKPTPLASMIFVGTEGPISGIPGPGVGMGKGISMTEALWLSIKERATGQGRPTSHVARDILIGNVSHLTPTELAFGQARAAERERQRELGRPVEVVTHTPAQHEREMGGLGMSSSNEIESFKKHLLLVLLRRAVEGALSDETEAVLAAESEELWNKVPSEAHEGLDDWSEQQKDRIPLFKVTPRKRDSKAASTSRSTGPATAESNNEAHTPKVSQPPPITNKDPEPKAEPTIAPKEESEPESKPDPESEVLSDCKEDAERSKKKRMKLSKGVLLNRETKDSRGPDKIEAGKEFYGGVFTM